MVEQPLRRPKVVRNDIFFSGLFISILLLAMTAGWIYKTNGAEFRFDSINKIVELNYWDESKGNKEAFFTYPGCWTGPNNPNPSNPFEICRSNEDSTRKKIMVIGDSHVAGLIPGLIKNFGRASIAERCIDACLPILGEVPDLVCNIGKKQFFEEIRTMNPNLIIIGGSWSDVNQTAAIVELFETELLSYKNKTILMGPLPRWGQKGLPIMLEGIYKKEQSIPFKLSPEPSTFVLEEAFSQVSRDLEIAYLSPVQALCDNGKCITKLSNSPNSITSWDYAHLTTISSNYLGSAEYYPKSYKH